MRRNVHIVGAVSVYAAGAMTQHRSSTRPLGLRLIGVCDYVEVGDPALVHAVLGQLVHLSMELGISGGCVDRRLHWREGR